ncbi:regulator of nonsense transcripts 3A-like [Cervus elaphus]|uniref:regulator of nonsense transcripts 3A-like n=1 Tax=Cervus elaphus TaxID=9860 RepID=UPI001CC2B447|nr:regulator of nonsense transcripts 3A-like [Cervus elaphus]
MTAPRREWVSRTGGSQRLRGGSCYLGSEPGEKLSPVKSQFSREAPLGKSKAPLASSFGCGGSTGKPCQLKRTALSRIRQEHKYRCPGSRGAGA